MSKVTVRSAFDYTKLNRIVKTASDELSIKKANKVQRLAKRQVHVKSGKLRRSIKVSKVYHRGARSFVSVGSTVYYARAHHNGTRAYIIRPTKSRFLKFKGGAGFSGIGANMDSKGNVYARSVMHPRVRANRYLTDSLRRVMAVK